MAALKPGACYGAIAYNQRVFARILARSMIQGRPLLSAACAVGALLLGALLLYEGSRPGTRVPLAGGIAHVDKAMHFSAHLLLTSMLLWAGLLWPRGRAAFRLRLAAVGAFALDCAFGAGAELVQYAWGQRFGRQAEWGDALANLAGTAVATLVFLMVVRWALRAYINRRRAGSKP